jgi:hypothetical protein
MAPRVERLLAMPSEAALSDSSQVRESDIDNTSRTAAQG